MEGRSCVAHVPQEPLQVSLDQMPGILPAIQLIHSLQVPGAWEKAVWVTRWCEIHLVVVLFSLVHYFRELLRGDTLPGGETFWQV